MNPLKGNDPGGLHQIFVNGQTAVIMQIRLRDGHPVYLGFKHCALHENSVVRLLKV
jgi:hypothetical protein